MSNKVEEEWGEEEKIPLHSHCIVCGRPIKYGETFCSEACRRKYEQMMKVKKRMTYALWALIAVFIVVIYLAMYFAH